MAEGRSPLSRIQKRHPKVSLARALSKLGYCSRTQAEELIKADRVRVNGVVCSTAETRVDLDRDLIEVDGALVTSGTKIYLMLNKPRGVVTTRSDEQGRDTVYASLAGERLPWVAPVGRLDKASEGLLLFTNDTRWAAGVLAPESHLDKTYHVQADRLVDESFLKRMRTGIPTEEGDLLRAKRVALIRRGIRNSWLEVVLDEGKNRQIRRLLEALGVRVFRLVRIAIGPVSLGDLGKGMYRHLTKEEKEALTKAVKRDETKMVINQ
jgi:23S rRNA pseudouridine2605 synthase